MDIQFSKSAVKALKWLDKPVRQNMRVRIEGLTKEPPEGDIKPMQGYSDGRFRLRVGKYRIIYKYVVDNSEKMLYIMDIGSRGDIYK